VNQIEKFLNFNNNIKTINRMGPYRSIALNVVSCYIYNEIVQLLLTNNAFKSLKDIFI
jgi:hypothetical protein